MKSIRYSPDPSGPESAVSTAYSPYRHLGTAWRCGAVRCGRRRSNDQDDRRVGLSPVARNTIRDSRFDVKSCIRHAAPTGGWITRGEVLRTRCSSTSASSSSQEANTLVAEPPTRRWSLVGGADEHLAARDPAASVSRLVTAQCALDCSLIQWCFGRRARARRDDRLDRLTASDRTAPHRTAPPGGPEVALRTVLYSNLADTRGAGSIKDASE